MALKTFKSIAQRLEVSVPGCPMPVIVNYIRDAAIDACERTLAWRYVQPPFVLTPGVFDYPYEVPTGSEVHAFLTASVNGRRVDVVGIEALHTLFPNWPDYSVEARGFPRFISQIDVDNFAVAPAPNSDEIYNVKMVLALKPLRSANGMDATALDDLENLIMHGALRDLLALPNKSWSDRELATYHAQQYLSAATERRARANLGAGRVSVSARMQPFA